MSTRYGSNPMDRQPFERQAGAEEQTSSHIAGADATRDRHSMVAAEREQSGGIKIGSAFFGWLTATGTAVLLTALLAAAGKLIAAAVAIAGAVGGSKYNILAQLNRFPRIPVNEGSLTKAGIIALIAVALASLVGAILGGMAGMRFHRRVDKAGLGA